MRHAYCFVAVIISLCVLMVSGCARLSVRVDVLNSAFWVSPEYVDSVTLAKIVGMDQAILDGHLAILREKLKKDVKQALVEVSKAPLPPGRQVRWIEPEVVDGLADNINKNTIDPYFETMRSQFQAAFEEASKARQTTKKAKELYSSGVQSLFAVVSVINSAFRVQLASLLRDPNMDSNIDKSVAQASQKLQENGAASVGGYIQGFGILDDPRAAAVVYAPQEYWTGPPYNRTLCNGFFGSSDCAVKMDGLGDFTLKGVRLDATKITQATFSVAREAIQVVAAVYGIPVPKSQPAQAGQAGQGSDKQALGEITSPIKRQRDAETAILQFRLARIAMFEAIVTQEQAISSTDAKTRNQAIRTIKGVLKANSKQLVPSPAQ